MPEGEAPEHKRKWRFDADVAAPGAARAALRAFVGGMASAPNDVSGMVLCVSEAVTNVVLHAYRDDDPSAGKVEVEAAVSPRHLWVMVRDRGRGLMPRVGSPGFGVGLPIISQTADATEIRTPSDGGTEIAMRFDLR